VRRSRLGKCLCALLHVTVLLIIIAKCIEVGYMSKYLGIHSRVHILWLMDAAQQAVIMIRFKPSGVHLFASRTLTNSTISKSVWSAFFPSHTLSQPRIPRGV